MIPLGILAAVPRGGGSTAPGLLNGMVSWWDSEEESGGAAAIRFDAHGPNHLTPASTVSRVAGKVGYATQAPGGVQLTKSSPEGLDFTTGDFCLATWFKASSSTLGLLSRYGLSGNHRMWSLVMEGGAGKLVVSSNGSETMTVAVGSGLNNDAWHFLIGWRATAEDKLYVQVDNGTPASVDFEGSIALHSSSQLLVALGLDSSTTYADGGVIDSSAAWSRSLSSEERGLLWNDGNGINYADLVAAAGS